MGATWLSAHKYLDFLNNSWGQVLAHKPRIEENVKKKNKFDREYKDKIITISICS